MKKEQLQSKIKFIYLLLFYLLVYGIMLIRHYSADSFAYNMDPLKNNEGNLALGRIGDYFINKIVVFLGGNYVKHQFAFVLFLIIVLAIVSNGIYEHYLKCIAKELTLAQERLLKASIVLMFCNVFLMEWFIFVEMTFIWGISLLFMLFAVLQIRKNFTIKRMLYSTVLIAVSVSFYQATIGFYVFFALMTVYILNQGNLNKKSFLDSVKVMICGAIGGGFDLAFIKVMQSFGWVAVTSRTESMTLKMLIDNILSIFYNFNEWLCTTHGLLPKGVIVVCALAIYALLIRCLKIKKAGIGEWVYIILLIIVSNIMVYLPHLMTSTIWMAQRTIASFFVIISLPAIVISIKSEKVADLVIGFVAMAILIGINVWKILCISSNVIASNRIDEEISYAIYNKIMEYEVESGQAVKTISICKDSNTTWGNRSIEYVCMDTNLRVFNVAHSGVQCINYYNGTGYKSVPISESAYNKYFSGKDWDYLDLDEQLVFEGNVAYFVSY